MGTHELVEDPPSQKSNARFWRPDRLAQAVRSSVLLATIGASIALFVFTAIGRTTYTDEFLRSNLLPLSQRHDLLATMAAASLICWWGPMVFVLMRRTDAELDQARRLALFLSPLVLLGVLVPLLRIPPWVNQPLWLGISTTVFVLILERTVGLAMDAAPPALTSWVTWLRSHLDRCPASVYRALSLGLVIASALAYGAFATFLTIRYHNRLGTAAFDLGGYDNIFYNALKGYPLRGTVAVPSGENWSSLRTHAEFSVYAFLPFYAIKPRAETLLCIQAFVVGLAAVPIYLLAARRLPRLTALLLASSYLLFAPVHSGNFYDFHFQPIASTLILWLFFSLDTKRNWLAVLFFLVAIGCREDVSISLAMAGVLMLASGYRPLAGVLMGVISAAYFLIVRFIVMPHFGSWWFQDMYKGLLPAGDPSLFGVLKTLISNPLFGLSTLLTFDKFIHVLSIFLPLAFLPLRPPCLWPGFVPAFLTTILTTGYHPTTDTTFQYIFYWVPFIFLGSALALERILRRDGLRRHTAAVIAMTAATLITSLHWGVVLQQSSFASAWGHIELGPLTTTEQENLRDLRELGAQIPASASVALSENENPHFSTRLSVYALKVGVQDADYILYRTDSGRGGADQAADALRTGHYEQEASKGKFVLLRRAKKP